MGRSYTKEERDLIIVFTNYFKKKLIEKYKDVDKFFLTLLDPDFSKDILRFGSLKQYYKTDLGTDEFIRVSKPVNGKRRDGIVLNPMVELSYGVIDLIDLKKDFKGLVEHFVNVPVIPCVLDMIAPLEYIDKDDNITWEATIVANRMVKLINNIEMRALAKEKDIPCGTGFGKGCKDLKKFIKSAQESLIKEQTNEGLSLQ